MNTTFLVSIQHCSELGWLEIKLSRTNILGHHIVHM